MAAQLAGIETLGKSSGFGDVSLYGLWRFLHDESAATDVGLIGGIKLPTGSDDRLSDTGERFESEFQPGSGSWDPFAGLAWRRGVGRFDLMASTVYALVTEGSQDTDRGDQWTYNLAAGYRLARYEETRWNAVLEINGGWRDREEIDDVTNGNSGGSWSFLSPGLNVTGDNWSVYTSFGFGVDDELHGDQDELGYRFLLGFQFLR
jgi:hypothetical protein